VVLKLNRTHQLLAYAEDVNLLGDNIDTVNKSTDTLIDASKEVGLEINVEKTKYMLLSHHQKACQDHDIKIANRPFENVAVYIFGKSTNKNLIREDSKRGLNSANVFYHLVQNLLFSRLVSKSVEVRICKDIIYRWFCMGVKLSL
jgi:hypothetical protein